MSLAVRTERAYRRAGLRFDRVLAEENVVPSAAEYVRVLTSSGRQLSASSWRFLRAAIKWWIAGSISEREAELFTRLFGAMKPVPIKTKRPPKRLPISLVQSLVNVLRETPRGRNKRIAADMLIAGPVVGLRPCEWARAELNGDVLRVQNAKYRPGISGNGSHRELVLQWHVITTEQRDAIRRLLTDLKGADWERIGGNIRRAFNNAKRRLKVTGEITKGQARTRLYEARHQFSADAKRTLDYAGGEVAGAMGHRAAMTAHSAYGNRSKATGTLPVKPTVESVEKVSEKSIIQLARSLAKAAAYKLGFAGASGSERRESMTVSPPSRQRSSDSSRPLPRPSNGRRDNGPNTS